MYSEISGKLCDLPYNRYVGGAWTNMPSSLNNGAERCFPSTDGVETVQASHSKRHIQHNVSLTHHTFLSPLEHNSLNA